MAKKILHCKFEMSICYFKKPKMLFKEFLLWKNSDKAVNLCSKNHFKEMAGSDGVKYKN